MAEPSGHTLLTDALRVINRAIAAHASTSPWREIIARTSPPEEAPSFGVAIYEGHPSRVVDQYAVRVHEGRFEVTEHGRLEPPDWVVSIGHLASVAAEAERFVAAPEALGLGWLEDALGLHGAKRRAGWRVGRVRRPK